MGAADEAQSQPYVGPRGCPCTPQLLCDTYQQGVFSPACDIPMHPERTYSMHGGAGWPTCTSKSWVHHAIGDYQLHDLDDDAFAPKLARAVCQSASQAADRGGQLNHVCHPKTH